MAASLKPIDGGNWVSQGRTLLAHAIAAGHLHDARGGRAAAQSIESLTKNIPYLRMDSARASLPDEIRAWARFSGGDIEGATELLRPLADRQAKIGKGEVELPAREMLAEMFLLVGKLKEALTEYQTSLISDPNRFNALLGAGNAAERLKKRKLAASYYRTLLANSSGATGEAVRELKHARSFTKTTDSPSVR